MAANMGISPEAQRALENNRVTVFIWTSGENADFPGENVGHVAVEVRGGREKHYFSFWPGKAAEGILDRVTPQYPENFETDCAYEARPPELMFCFYYLRTASMIEEIERLKSADIAWTLLGDFREKCESCASSAWKVLEKGGINEFISAAALAHSRESSKASGGSRMFASAEHAGALIGIKSPDGVAMVLLIAKKDELSKHSEAQHMSRGITVSMEDESFELEEYKGKAASAPTKVNKPGCRMM